MCILFCGTRKRVDMTKIFVSYKPCRERNYKAAWVAKTGNIITTSTVSKEQAIEKHKKKLRKIIERTDRT